MKIQCAPSVYERWYLTVVTSAPRINGSRKFIPAKNRVEHDVPERYHALMVGKQVLGKINDLLARRTRSSDIDGGPTPLDERPSTFCDQRTARLCRRYPFRDHMHDLHFARIVVVGRIANRNRSVGSYTLDFAVRTGVRDYRPVT